MASERSSFFKQVFDPSSELMVQWSKIMFVVGLINFSLDPLFVFIPTVNSSNMVVSLDLHLATSLTIIRTVTDLLLVFGIVVNFRTAYEDPGSKIFKRRRLIENPKQIAIKYLRSSFIVDLIAVLPLPQAYIWHQVLASKTATLTRNGDGVIFFTILEILVVQYLPRFLVLTNSKTKLTKRAGILMKSAMSGACYNLLWFVSLSNFVGAIYYVCHIHWLLQCKDMVEEKMSGPLSLQWDQLLSTCTENNGIEQGMISGALTNKIGTRNFIQRYMFCFSWGLKSLSSLGQNFTTSFSTWETTLSISITLYGLILLADLITRMQAGIQSMEEREEQQRARQREVKEWAKYHLLPLELKERVNHAIQSEWIENGFDDEAMLNSLPMSSRSEIRKYLYMNYICKLPKFADMDPPLVEAICQHLKTFSGKENTYVVYEGDVVKQMLFIFSGQLELSFTDRGNASLTILGPGECCGQELVTWATQPTTSMDNLPSSTWTIKCLTDVEAFVLQAYEMKILATQFAHNQEFQRAFKQHYP